MRNWAIMVGDSHSILLPNDCIDAVVTDPPYGLTQNKRGGPGGFMGMKWDAGVPDTELWEEVFRVMKPGAHLLAFFGTRTYHRGVTAIEDAGFEIRDQIAWVYGSGFPKSLDVSKAIDKAAGEQREAIGYDATRARPNRLYGSGAIGNIGGHGTPSDRTDNGATITAPATPAAQEWSGWGTALKPAMEPIVVARKPLVGTVAANVLEWGTGALNIDGCRIATTDKLSISSSDPFHGADGSQRTWNKTSSGAIERDQHALGRWPANLVLSHTPECKCVGTKKVKSGGGDVSGQSALGQGSGWNRHENRKTKIERQCDADGLEEVESWECAEGCPVSMLDEQSGPTLVTGSKSPRSKAAKHSDSGSASRFFYAAKASRKERNAGLEAPGNIHPTVKPVALMRYLCRLVCPPDGVVLDPFAGTGSTGIAALMEGFDFLGIELNGDYAEMARKRIEHAAAEMEREEGEDDGQQLFPGMDDDE